MYHLRPQSHENNCSFIKVSHSQLNATHSDRQTMGSQSLYLSSSDSLRALSENVLFQRKNGDCQRVWTTVSGCETETWMRFNSFKTYRVRYLIMRSDPIAWFIQQSLINTISQSQGGRTLMEQRNNNIIFKMIWNILYPCNTTIVNSVWKTVEWVEHFLH